MKVITIRELHQNTGRWVRQASHFGEIRVSDNGRVIAKLLPEKQPESPPFFSRRTLSPAFRRLAAGGKFRGGTDSTASISADREDRTR